MKALVTRMKDKLTGKVIMAQTLLRSRTAGIWDTAIKILMALSSAPVRRPVRPVRGNGTGTLKQRIQICQYGADPRVRCNCCCWRKGIFFALLFAASVLISANGSFPTRSAC